jgi:ketosteroid isomerase-like protein
MSRADAEFVREGYEALARGDMETFTSLSREHLAPDFEFHAVWDGRVFRGFEGTMKWISDTRETWEDYSQQVEELIELGDVVVVVLAISARGGGSGVPVAQELAVVWRFDDGKAIEARSFTSRAEALEAAGVAGD